MSSLDQLAKTVRRYVPVLRPAGAAARYAAVAAVLRESHAGVEVLLIRRTESPADPWSGHMAMPGGKQEPQETLVATAVRETHEEVGVDLSRAELLGRLDDTTAIARGRPTNMVIAPFVFMAADAQPRPSDEVQEVVWVPLGDLLLAEHRSVYPYRNAAGMSLELPCWSWRGYIIWGLTHHMLSGLLTLYTSEPSAP